MALMCGDVHLLSRMELGYIGRNLAEAGLHQIVSGYETR